MARIKGGPKRTRGPRGSYNMPKEVKAELIIANTSRAMSDPYWVEDALFKEMTKEIRKLKIKKTAEDYFNDITSDWSKRGHDKSRVRFKVDVRSAPYGKTGIDFVLVMKGSPLGIERFKMIDTEGRKGGATISVSGTVTKSFTEEASSDTFGFTASDVRFDMKRTHGRKRKRKVTEETLDKLGVYYEDPISGEPFTRKQKKTIRKVMPLAEYERKTQGPWLPKGSGYEGRKYGAESKYQPPYATMVKQGAVEPKYYTKAFLKAYIYAPSDFRRQLINASRRGMTKVLRQKANVKKAVARKAAKKAATREYKGKGKFLGRASRKASQK